MKRYVAFVILTIGIIYSFSIFAYGQNETPSVDPEREIIVMFKSDAITPPSGRTRGRPDEFNIPSQALRQILRNANVQAISRLMPDFRPEDRFAISQSGETVQLTDWTHVYVLLLPSAPARKGLRTALENRPGVLYAEINDRVELATLIPNDPSFNRQWALKNDGTALQGNGTAGADINVTQAWDITTGSSSIKIGIVDGGMQTDHPDFTGRVSGDAGDDTEHGTAVTGIAAAQGNNGIGIAGVAWNVGIINEDFGTGSTADAAAAVLSAANRGAHVINNSWSIPTNSSTVRAAFADVYKLNRVAVAAMGNQFGEVTRYPARHGQGIIAVGATTNEDVRAVYSNTGSWIDVTAPGGTHSSQTTEDEDYIFSTVPGSSYDLFLTPEQAIWGTSFSTPHVTGIAALLLSYNSSLYNDDIEQIIRLGVDDLGPPGFDTEYGTGRVNARKALDFLRSPYSVNHWTRTGGTVYSTSGFFQMGLFSIPGLADDVYIVKRHVVRKSVTFPSSFSSTPYVWGRGVASVGYSKVNPNFGMGFCDVVDGTITTTGVTLETVVYQVWTTNFKYKGYFPTTANNTVFAYTALGIQDPPPPQPPAPPQNLVITNPGAIGQNPNLTWNASTGATSYNVYRRVSFLQEWWLMGATTSTSYTDYTLEILDPSDPDADEFFYHVTAVNSVGESGPSNSASVWGFGYYKSTSDQLTELPEKFDLGQNYPNPFNPETELRYSLPKGGYVELVIVNLLGKPIRTLVLDAQPAGWYRMIWDGRNDLGNQVGSGIYFYRLDVKPEDGGGQFTQIRKMTLLR